MKSLDRHPLAVRKIEDAVETVINRISSRFPSAKQDSLRPLDELRHIKKLLQIIDHLIGIGDNSLL